MFADQVLYDVYFNLFSDPTASAMAYGQRLKFAMDKHLALAKGENCAYSPHWFQKEMQWKISQK